MARTQKAKKSKANAKKKDPWLDPFLETQKRLTEDYLGNPREKGGHRKCDFTLVRDANGQYWKVSTDHCPEKVGNNEELQRFLEDLNDLVSLYFHKHCGHRGITAGTGVHVGTPEIFPK